MIIGRILFRTCCLAGVLTAWGAERDGFTLRSYNPGNIHGAAIGNGQIGMVVNAAGTAPERVFSATAFGNASPGHISSIIEAFCPIEVSISDGCVQGSTYRQELDMYNGEIVTSWTGNAVRFSSTWRTLRQLPFLSMVEVELTALRDGKLTVVCRPGLPAATGYSDCRFIARAYRGQGTDGMTMLTGNYSGGRETMVAVSAVVAPEGWAHHGADTIQVEAIKGRTYSFMAVGALCTSVDFKDAWNEAERQVIYAMRLGRDRLLEDHRREWSRLWASDIEIEGDAVLQMQVRSALYNLYSSLRGGSRMSLGPTGLTADGYYGHVFWDADTWILPAMAVLQPEMACSMIDYRFDRLDAARRRARAYGYSGAMFPWESDFNGEESTPTWALTGPLEHHITADVANAAWQYFCVTGDTVKLRDEIYPLMSDCADFWVSRSSPNPDGSFSINNVVGADEYAEGVDDDAFTNGAAKVALLSTCKAAGLLGAIPDPMWRKVADGLKFHYDKDGTMLEHRTYSGEMIKQSDVTLLQFPLGLMTDSVEVALNNRRYEQVTDSINGPAMSHSVMAVMQARGGNGGEALRLLRRSFEPNLRGPFNMIAETPDNDRTYFMTGAGGLVQGIIFGPGGVAITDSGLRRVKASLPPGIRRITVRTPFGDFTNGAEEK